jgi:hypothetical protein
VDTAFEDRDASGLSLSELLASFFEFSPSTARRDRAHESRRYAYAQRREAPGRKPYSDDRQCAFGERRTRPETRQSLMCTFNSPCFSQSSLPAVDLISSRIAILCAHPDTHQLRQFRNLSRSVFALPSERVRIGQSKFRARPTAPPNLLETPAVCCACVLRESCGQRCSVHLVVQCCAPSACKNCTLDHLKVDAESCAIIARPEVARHPRATAF